MKPIILYVLCFFLFTSIGTSCKSAFDRQSPVGQTWVPKHNKSKNKMKKYNSRRKKH